MLSLNINHLYRIPLIKWLLINVEATILLVLLIIGLFYLEFHKMPAPSLDNSERRKAKFKKINRILLTKTPQNCVVFGKYKNQYVVKPLTEAGHCIFIGGSGSGKSAAGIINALLSADDISTFSIDIKGELSLKSKPLNHEKTIVFNPCDKNSYGYEPLWLLHDKNNITDSTIYEVMQEICISLISIPPDMKDPYWKMNARTLLTGLFMYYFKNGYENIVDITDVILSDSIQNLLKEIQEDIDETSIEYRLLNTYFELNEKTLSCITTEAVNSIRIFSTDENIRYAFRNNYRKCNPSMLENKIHMFFSIPEEKLEPYFLIVQMVINQVLNELTKRKEGSFPILLLLDEFPRILISKLDKLQSSIRTLRSKGVTIVLVVQSLESIQIAYSKAEVSDLVANCPYILVFNASSIDTIKSIQEWAGKYIAPHHSISGIKNDSKSSISYNAENIIDGMDLMTLQGTKHVILISPYGFYMIDKCFYFKDTFFKKKQKQIYIENLKYLDEQPSTNAIEHSDKISQQPETELTIHTASSDTSNILNWNKENNLPVYIELEDLDMSEVLFLE